MFSLKSCSIDVTMLYLKYLWKACQIDQSVRLAPISSRMVQKTLDILLSEWNAGAHPPSVVFSSNHLNTSFRDFCLFPFSLVFDDECMAGYHCLVLSWMVSQILVASPCKNHSSKKSRVFSVSNVMGGKSMTIWHTYFMVIQPICSTKINNVLGACTNALFIGAFTAYTDCVTGHVLHLIGDVKNKGYHSINTFNSWSLSDIAITQSHQFCYWKTLEGFFGQSFGGCNK